MCGADAFGDPHLVALVLALVTMVTGFLFTLLNSSPWHATLISV